MYFSFDLGHNIQVRDCLVCGVTLYEQPKESISDVEANWKQWERKIEKPSAHQLREQRLRE
jgi:hypothetical protein